MPTLHWVGKDKVVRHHHDVPFKVLKREYRFASAQPAANTSTGNKIIHGDNLEALKALLPEYEGRIQCIYIDPPYNTGNEGWVYNDNVNDPRLLKWLNKVVGKEGEDLSRHDKWLCMMYPRLKLLHRLLAEDGSMWVSIDGNEQASLRLLLDEIFGVNNLVSEIVWQKRVSPANDAKFFSSDHEYIFVYARNKNIFTLNRLERTENQLSNYKNPDGDPRGNWNSVTYTCNKTADERPNLYYGIKNPNTGDIIFPKKTAVWKYDEKKHMENETNNLLFWGMDGKNKAPRMKRFLEGMGNVVPRSIFQYSDFGHTQEARTELLGILENSAFSTTKPVKLISRILEIASNQDSIILDSFAGSGTTAHAVLKLNAQDGGKRKFILVEMMDYAETITAERVRRVMDGYGENPPPPAPLTEGEGSTTPIAGRGSKVVEGLGGGFEYFTLGEALFTENGQLNEAVGVEAILRYVAYSERIADFSCPLTQLRQTDSVLKTESVFPREKEGRCGELPPAKDATGCYYLGETHGVQVYFIYQPDRVTSLDVDLLAQLPVKPGKLVIYADQCLLGEDFMRRHGIIFKKIPRDITRF